MMETKSIRPETLTPGDYWVPPTGDEIREVLCVAGLTGEQAARLLGLPVKKHSDGGRTIRRWTSGDSPIPYAAWALLVHSAGLGEIWIDSVD